MANKPEADGTLSPSLCQRSVLCLFKGTYLYLFKGKARCVQKISGNQTQDF